MTKITVDEMSGACGTHGQKCKLRSAGNIKEAREILTRRWKDNIKIVIKVTVEDVGWIRAGKVAGSSENSN